MDGGFFLFVKDFMITDFINCSKDHTLKDVLPMFTNTYTNILPVVDHSNKLEGIITKNKLFSILTRQPSLNQTVEQYYNPHPIYLRPNDTIEDTRKLLLKHNLGHAPVVDEKMMPIGLLSTKQVLWSYNILYIQLESVIEFAYDAIILVNKKAEITMVNKGFTDLFGLESKDVLNQATSKLFPQLEIENVITRGIGIHNTPLMIQGHQTLISILPIKQNGETISAICKITYRGLTHLHEALTKVKKLEKQVSAYQNEINEIKGTKYTLFDIAGDSTSINHVKHEALQASKSMSTVLIVGESGTGKELFAQGIHAASGQMGAFVQVNCAAIPHDLLESEFFGYTEGAFTGAKKGGMKGKFELAQNGTLFLDEIGEMPLTLQTKLLRVLQEKEFQPIGSTKTIHLNTKIIAATNQNIEQMVEDGTFRADLYYRLNIMRLNIPPLRERMEDIPDIVQIIINRLNQSGFYLKGVTHSAFTKLMKHSWPGNVRELHNVLERAANLTTSEYIEDENIPQFGNYTKKEIIPKQMNTTFKGSIQETEKDIIIAALQTTNGNKTQASKLLGISRPWLYAKIKKYEIE